MQKSFFLRFIGLPVLSLMLMIGYPTGSARAKTNILNIGLVQPFSGPASIITYPMLRAAKMVAEDINNAGGVKAGGKTYKIKIVYADDAYTSAGGVASFNRLILKKGVKFILGSVGSAPTLAAQPITESNKVLIIHQASSLEALGKDKPFSFRMFVGAIEGPSAFYRWIHSYDNSIKTVAMINPDDVTGHNTAKYSQEFAKRAGIKVLVSEFYQRGTQDFRSIILKMLNEKPDLIDFGASVDFPVIAKQLLELGYTGKKALCAAAFPPQLMMKLATPEAMEGSIIGYLDPDAPKATERYKDIFKRYYEKNNELPGPMGILAYDSLSWLIAAIEKADTLDTTKVRDTLEKLPFETSYGIARWKGKEMYGINRLAIYPSYWSEVKGGKLVYIGESEAKLIPMIK